MNRFDLNKKKIMDEITTNDFARMNGSVIRTIGTFARPWLKGTNIKDAFPQADESDIYAALDYLQQCGLISVRIIDTKESVEVYDFDLDEIEVRTTADGVKLLMMKKKDELVELL